MTTPVTSNLSSIARTSDVQAKQAQASTSNAMGKDAFLRLFTTQLQNQDPTDPVKNEAFVAQLAQFSQLEATTSMAGALDNLVASLKGDKLMTGAALVGRQVAAPNMPAVLSSGQPVTTAIDLPGDAESVRIDIYDPSGQAIRSVTMPNQRAGILTYVWDGRDDNGGSLADGNYRMVATATIAGRSSQISIGPMATVKSVSASATTTDPLLELTGGQTTSLSSVLRIGN